MFDFKYEIDAQFKDCEEFVCNIKEYFNSSSMSIHKARNELKCIPYDGKEFVVKSFKKPNFFRSIIYSFFCNSKAKKSYTNALKLQNLKINTPQPIAYIEFYKFGLLAQSFYITQKLEYDFTIRDILRDKNFPNRNSALEAFSEFTAYLHSKGVLHQDYSRGNILGCFDNNEYIFYLVDINRMKFKELTYSERIKNFSKLWTDEEDLEVIIDYYQKSSGLTNNNSFEKALYFSNQHKNFINLKKKIKGKKVND